MRYRSRPGFMSAELSEYTLIDPRVVNISDNSLLIATHWGPQIVLHYLI